MTLKSRFRPLNRHALSGALLGAGLATGAFALSVGEAQAQTTNVFAGSWTMTIGAEGRVVPQFEGAKNYRIRPMPIFSLQRSGAPNRFRAPDDGIRIGLVEVENVRVGAVGKFRGRRAESDAAALQGLGNVGFTAEIGGFAEIWATQNFRLSAEMRHGIGGHTGVLADLGADLVMRPDMQWTLSVGPRLSWSNAEYNRTYFGVTREQQAAGSRLALYSPGSGIRSLGLVGSASYAVTPDWTVRAFARYDRLAGDVRKSPLVRTHGSPNQFSAGFGLSYSFNADMR
jgi:outer membrane protein